jgi:hypothetical protein
MEEQRREIDRLQKQMDSVYGEPLDETRPLFGMNLGILGDINFTTNSREKEHKSFYIGDVDLYSTFSYGERLNFLSEITIEVEEGEEFELDLERVWVGYTFNDLLIIRAGKQFSAIGYWSKVFGHSRHFAVTVDRPFFLNFEESGNLFPIRFIGLGFEGTWRHDLARFKYELDVANGPSLDKSRRRLEPNTAFDTDDSKQFTMRLSLSPSALRGLSIGVFGTVFKVDTITKAGLHERIYGADIVYEGHGIEFQAEYFRLSNSDAAGDAFYVQLAYEVIEYITPYTRFESLEVDEDDPYATSLGKGFDRYQAIIGVRYDIGALKSAIKAQYRYDDSRDGNDYNVFEMQWSFGF